jgi:hypothetical protein
MQPTSSGEFTFAISLVDEQATNRLAADLATMLQPGDTVTLSGGLGAGKTTLARALIRHLAADQTLEVPSPTFTLIQTYDLPRFAVAHIDLYRLSDASELVELGLDDLTEQTVCLVEWPEQAGGQLPQDRFDIALKLSAEHGSGYRNARITGYGAFAPRAERLSAMRRFFEKSGFAGAQRTHMQGDASTRAYERLLREGQSYVFMNAPQRADGPPVRDGKSYSAIAHLAEDVTPFLAMANALRARRLSAPAIIAADRAQGFLIIEDLGTEGFVTGSPPQPIEERYAVATDVLVALHRQPLPAALPVEPGTEYTLPRYDIEAMLIEAELLLDWYLPMLGMPPSVTRRRDYAALWRDILAPIMLEETTWVLRDFHSPNLLWLAERSGIARVGLLDFQDAVMGSPCYDLASLLQDARVDIPELMEITLLSRYTRERIAHRADFDAPAFAQTYSVLAAQRASKILGIFARLDRRDGKPQYLRHVPRVWGYLQRSLAHPALAPLKSWYGANVPDLKTI